MVLKNHHSQDFLIPRYKYELNHAVTAIIKVQDGNHTFYALNCLKTPLAIPT